MLYLGYNFQSFYLFEYSFIYILFIYYLGHDIQNDAKRKLEFSPPHFHENLFVARAFTILFGFHKNMVQSLLILAPPSRHYSMDFCF